MIERVLEERARLGECPVWSAEAGRLYWVDIDSRLVHRTDPDTGFDEVRSLDVRPGAIALTDDGDRLLVAAEHDLFDLSWSTGELSRRIELEPHETPTRLNDGRCDPRGRFWVGSMVDSPSAHHDGMLHLVEPDNTTRVMETGVGVSNGLAFSPDGTVMYWADTHRDLVWAWDYQPDTARRTRQRVFLDFADLPGRPDGACVDETGCYWIACVYGWTLLRVTPEGSVDRIVDLPVEKPSMPAFGGDDLDTLFVTSISSGGSQPASPGQDQAGCLFAIDPGVRGLPEPHFAG